MKKIFLLFLTFSFAILAINCFAQNAKIDSLITQIGKAKEDTNKVKLYYDLICAFIISHPEEGQKYVLPAVRLSEKLGWGVFFIKEQSGRLYWKLGQWDMALKYHFEALNLVDEKNDPLKFAQITTDIGQDYADRGDYPEALKYFEKAKKIYLKLNNENGLGYTYFLISFVHSMQGNFVESANANMAALKVYESLNDEYSVAVALSNLASDYLRLDKNKEALYYLMKVIPIQEKNKDYPNLSATHLVQAQAYRNLKNYEEALKHIQIALDYGKMTSDKNTIGNARSEQADIYFMLSNYPKAAEFYQLAIENYRDVNANHRLAARYGKLGICYVRLTKPEQARAALDSAALYGKSLDSRALLSDYLNGLQLYDSLKGNWKNAYLNHYKYLEIRDSIYNAENTAKLMQNQVQYEFDKKEAETKAEQEKKDIVQRTIRNSIATTLAGALIFLVVVYRQRNKISKARKRSDELLLNILPEEVAEELKAKGSADAKQFDEVTVMFTDFKGFTQLSEKLTPTELIAEINECFSAFDHIMQKYGVEKIKTIGDAYMAVGGLPVSNQTHAEDVVRAALDIQQFMHEHKLKKQSEGKLFFEIRIGVHTGAVVAGIVGVKKFAYDIWGDTVNIASRMESSGETGKVNISGSTYELVKDKFNCIQRGKIQAKNKGEIDMYFVETVS